jgi:hypothetical protein
MFKFNYLLLLFVIISLGAAAKPTQRFEAGFQLIQTEQSLFRNLWGSANVLAIKSLVFSTNEEYGASNFFPIPDANGHNIHAAAYLRTRLWKRLWIQYRPEFFSSSITTEKPFAPTTDASFSLSFNRYDKKVRGTNQVLGLQFQWVQAKKLWIYSGMEVGYSVRKVQDSSNGYSWGCFGGGPIVPFNGIQRGFSMASITTGASYYFCHGFGLSIQTGLNLLQPNTYQSLSITKRF